MSSCAAEQFYRDTSLEAVGQQAPNNSKNCSSRQLTAHWSTATGVLMAASSIRRRLMLRGLFARVPLYRNPLAANPRRLRLQWAYEHRA
ncbi:hypothetical protein TNCV_74511 [Trichonephila clavipes]|nr:hypothetical protein TNCV_74511 [Trichonephila clavipes]